jgi:adenylate cyclase, class 2
MTEIEVKILEINRAEIERKLLDLGAKKVREEIMEAVIYFASGKWGKGDGIRIRKEKGKVMLTIKRALKGKDAKFMDEEEIEVEEFDKMRHMMVLLGFKEAVYYKKRRITYDLADLEIVIDKYLDDLDHIPEYIEIEGPTTEKVYAMVEKLGYKKSDCNYFGFSQLFDYYADK